MNPIGKFVNDPGLKKRRRLTDFQRTSHASVVENLSSKRERKSIKQKSVVFLKQHFRSRALPTQISQEAYNSAEDIRAAESKDET